MKKRLIIIFISLSLTSLVSYAQQIVSSDSEIPVTEIPVMAVATTTSVIMPDTKNQQVTIKNTSIPTEGVLIKTDKFYRLNEGQTGLLTIVQDFYITGEKRTDPYLVTDIEKAQCNDFDILTYDNLGINGLFISWYKNGQVEQKGVFDQEHRKGLWVSWYENGQKKTSGRYKNGLKEGQWTVWYQNGKRMQKGIYREGKREGVWIFWYGNGKKKDAGRYSADEKVERWSYWDESGKMIKNEVMDEATY